MKWGNIVLLASKQAGIAIVNKRQINVTCQASASRNGALFRIDFNYVTWATRRQKQQQDSSLFDWL